MQTADRAGMASLCWLWFICSVFIELVLNTVDYSLSLLKSLFGRMARALFLDGQLCLTSVLPPTG